MSTASADPPEVLVLTTISVSPQTASIIVGASERFQATAQDQHGNTISGVTFVFTSSGNAATVDSTGMAKGYRLGPRQSPQAPKESMRRFRSPFWLILRLRRS